MRRALGGAGVEFAARAYGPRGQEGAAAMAAQGSRAELADGTAVLEKTHGVVAISWRAVGRAATPTPLARADTA
ncbi:hypothetical protein HTZ77_05350 [Nonomuraea sp. SMC257]|uniref:Uncharacterized protein n=1 Tax=Nonomuraea montanisoli TaxID=2741721 RepID=A0A7Y6M261_9ACTN|nr:hypothetical protein [Nonomuraea montanisoli]NUW30844.1 hypothetical protein [Nonomuraea montanisoli]